MFRGTLNAWQYELNLCKNMMRSDPFLKVARFLMYWTGACLIYKF